MRISRYLDAKAFCDEAKKLKAAAGGMSEGVLERLEEQRSLIPRLRLRYPDSVERRWWAECHEHFSVEGEIEPDGERWDNANDLEKARQCYRFNKDPTVNPHVLDHPEPRFAAFIEKPATKPFVSWRDYRVSVGSDAGVPIYSYDTVVTYYSAWQLLQFAEVVNMGVISLLNMVNMSGFPSNDIIADAPKCISIQPIYVMHDFEKHSVTLDAIVWFAEEAELGYANATRQDNRRRLMSKTERDEILRTRLWAAEQAQRHHGIGPDALLSAVQFLCEQWSHWQAEGRPLIADAYKAIAGQGVRFACLVTGMSFEQYGSIVGRADGHPKPILDVIWPNWSVDQRDNLKFTLASYRSENALLRADFSDALIDRFLNFIEENNLYGFYWRMESFTHHMFDGNGLSLEGLKGDVQGMAIILEHIATALGAKKEQLRDKFKDLWACVPAVLKLLKNNQVMKVGNGTSIDLDWFEGRNGRSLHDQIAADLAISYAIRGGAHRVINETDPFKLELMMLIMLRAAVRTFEAVTNSASSQHTR